MKLSLTAGRVLLYSILMALVSCSTQTPSPGITSTIQSSATQSPVTQENLGEQVARHINQRYNDVRTHCGSASQPSFLCNGVLLRGTGSGSIKDYHVWNNSKASKARGGVSFSYLRKDDNFQRLALGYTNGFIFQSYSHVPNKLQPEILCSFPLDAWTDGRDGSGCGAYSNRPTSRPCDQTGIVNAAQWWTHFSAATGNKNAGQCGFDTRDSRNALAGPAFDASIKARAYLKTNVLSVQQNEVVIKAWADGLGKTLPLEAFFYLFGTDGLAEARRNQLDLKKTHGILIPIISIRLARSETDVATFYYLPGDQIEPMPPVR